MGTVPAVSTVEPDLDAARAQVADHGLTPDAVALLNPLVKALPLESLAPVKQLLKRFFSGEPWTEADDGELADIVGPGSGVADHELEPGLVLRWSWPGGRFRLRVESDTGGPDGHPKPTEPDATLDATFDGVVIPEATPSPRTIRFATPPIHGESSRVYESAETAAGDPRVARLFERFDEVTNVLVGPDFVAVTISRPDRWETLLSTMLDAITTEFASNETDVGAPETEAPMTMTLSVGSEVAAATGARRLERAWTELGALRADRPEDLERVLAASRDDESARRQVAAALLVDAPPAIAARAWHQLLDDRSRVVRRSVVDAVAGAEREELRALLEQALDDPDAWTRWKALRGIAGIGIERSRMMVEARSSDADFRVRLEAQRVLAAP